MTDKISVSLDSSVSDRVILREGDAVPLQIKISGVTSSLSSPTMAFYKEGSNSDVSSTYFTGSMAVSGLDTIITKTPTGLKRGNWVLSVGATIDGYVQVACTIPITIKRNGEL